MVRSRVNIRQFRIIFFGICCLYFIVTCDIIPLGIICCQFTKSILTGTFDFTLFSTLSNIDNEFLQNFHHCLIIWLN